MNKIKNILKASVLSLPIMISQLFLNARVFATTMVNGVLVNTPSTGGGMDETFNKLFTIARTIVAGITGILSIVMVFIFAWKAFQFARTGDNPSERVKSINGMIFFFIGAACFGAASLITGVFSGMLTGI